MTTTLKSNSRSGIGRMSSLSSSFLMKLLFLFLMLVAFNVISNVSVVYSKEIEATNEWTLLGENDTIPAGLHVKIDMTTGEKWVKQIDPNDDNDGSNDDHQQQEAAKVSTSKSTAAAIIQSDGSVQVDINDNTNGEDSSSQGNEDGDEKPNYDFEMMYRTLSNLPKEEQERMGGLPDLPKSSESSESEFSWSSLTPEQRQIIETRMEEIWVQRQEELRRMEEEYVVDLPQILKDRINRIQEYLLDPMNHLSTMDLDSDDEDEEDNGSSSSSSNDVVTHIISVLEDLELQLTDVDMARDFHTLGGWPLLVSLLADDTHISQNYTTSTSSSNSKQFPTNSLGSKKLRVQAYAAWVIGTAIKNTGEFFPYAIEEVDITKRSDDTTSDGGEAKIITTTAIDLLIGLFLKEYDDDDSSLSSDITFVQSKAIYGIGALLRGNRVAQTHVCATDGPTQLATKLNDLVKSSDSKNKKKLPSSNVKLIQRLLSLASDIITDVQNLGDEKYQTTNEQLHDAIIQSFTGTKWCDATITLLSTDVVVMMPTPLVETALTTVNVMGPYCHDTWWQNKGKKIKPAQKSLVALKKKMESNSDDYDSDHHEELLQLVETSMQALEKKK